MAQIRAEVEARLIGLIGLINLKFMLIRGSGPPDSPNMKHKVDANQILDAFEKDQDAQQLFRNAEKMIDGEFDVEAAREFWARWKTLSCFQKTRLWLQSSRYEMLCPGLHRPHRSFHCSLLVSFFFAGNLRNLSCERHGNRHHECSSKILLCCVYSVHAHHLHIELVESC